MNPVTEKAAVCLTIMQFALCVFAGKLTGHAFWQLEREGHSVRVCAAISLIVGLLAVALVCLVADPVWYAILR